MKFNEKMIFLMETTGVSNKVLADKINVDPSMISLLRTGRRGKPRNEAHLQAMADFFASQFRTIYQRENLAEIIGQFNLKYKSDYRDIAPILYQWLKDDNYQPPSSVERVMAKIYRNREEESVKDTSPLIENTYSHELHSSGLVPQETTVFYGDEGKMQAISCFHNYLMQAAGESDTLYFTSDESNGWYMENQNITNDVQFWQNLIDRTGCRICLILPPSTSPVFLDFIAEWLPLFLSGKMDVYYYPRTRDRIYRRTMLILEKKAALFCNSVASSDTSAFSVFTRDPALIDANTTMFRSYLAQCQRTFQVYFKKEEMANCFMKYASINTESIMLSQTLPQSSMPPSCMQLMFSDEIHPLSKESPSHTPIEDSYQRFRAGAQKRYQDYVTIEIASLSTYDEVADGKVMQIYPGNTASQEYVYTPETYMMHLKHIVYLLKTYPDYYFVPSRKIPYTPDNIVIKPDRYCLIVHPQPPRRIMEISQPTLIQPFYEFLTNIADRAHYSGSGKRRIIAQLENLMEDFEKHMQ